MFMIASMQGLSDALVHLAGFLFVVFVLSLLWLVVELVGRYFRGMDARKSVSTPAATVAAPAAPAAAVSPDEVSEEDLVIIAATTALLLGRKPHRLVSIRTSSMGWSQEGRRQHMQSHKVLK